MLKRFPRAPLAVFMLLILWSCGGEESAPPSPADTPIEAQAEQPTTPPTPEELAPVLREAGAAGVVPEKVVVEFGRPVATEEQVKQAVAEGTLFEVRPPIPGKAVYTSTTTVAFLPEGGFLPGQTYEVELRSVATPQGVVQSPAPGRWTRTFDTPGFNFVRLALAGVDFVKRNARLELVFSSAVDPKEVGRRSNLRITPQSGGGSVEPRVSFERGRDANTVLATVSGTAVDGGARVRLALEDGVPSQLARGLAAGSARREVVLEMGPVAKVLASYREEGESGFYVQVICDDSSVAGKRYYWDRTNYESYRISTRCQLDEAQARSGIHFEPAVDFDLSPAGGGFRIFGDFQRGSYTMRLDAGLRTVDGGMLHEAWNTEISIPARSPKIDFLVQGRYLPRSAFDSLPVRHRNVRGTQLLVRHVPAENLVFWMGGDNEAASGRTANLVVKTDLQLRGEADTETTSYVDLASLIPSDVRGLLEVRLQSGGASSTARILLTDLHLIAKRGVPSVEGGQREVQVWTADVDSLDPQSGVEVSLVRPSGYAVARCRTAGDGGCLLRPDPQDVDSTEGFALVARRGQDLTYMKFDELKAEVQEERVAGQPYRGEQKYRAALYGDRGVYRPGETAHLAAIVRGEDHRAPEAGLPVQLTLRDPQGKVVRKTSLATNAAGLLSQDLSFPAFATTGRYEARLEVANRAVGRLAFQVEEFVPERMRVEVDSKKEEVLLGEALEMEVSARYLFGGIPADHRVEMACELVPGTFQPRENAQYQYGVWRAEDQPVRPLDLGVLEARLDGEGQGTYACPGRAGVVGGPAWRGPAQLQVRAAVFEAGGGRTTLGRGSVPVHPENFYIGLDSSATKMSQGNEVVVRGIAVDWDGRPAGSVDTIQLEWIRLEQEWGWFYDEARGYDLWRQYLRPVVESREEVTLTDSKFEATWTPNRDGAAFLVRASAGNARTEKHFEGEGSWYWWGPEESEAERTPRPGRPTWLALDTPETAKPGEPFPVRFTVPYRGRVLLTVETDELLSSEWLDVDPGDAVWFPEVDDFVPNVYVTAFLMKDPHLDSADAYMPDRAFGVRSVRLEPEAFTHQLALEVPSEVRSRSRLAVRLDLGKSVGEGPTWATVAAVDEGVLSLTRFESPDPAKEIFTRRALGVETFETVGWTLLVPPSGPSSVTGGDGQGALGRVQPVKPVALWSGLVEVGEDGVADVAFDLPQYRGELRVMAVTAGAEKMGWADAQVTVRDPLVVQSTVPRFLTRDDTFQVPVQVTNLSGKSREVSVGISVEALEGVLQGSEGPSPVELIGPTRRAVSLADGAGDTVVFEARTRQSVGAAKFTVQVVSGELESIEEVEVPLLPSGPKSRRNQRLELEAGTTDLSPYLTGWLPLSERTTVWVTSNPYGETFSHLDSLLRYPYGCIEQTTSTTRPLLYLASLAGQMGALEGGSTVDDMVRSGIARILSMQTPDGGFSYWPGGTQPAYWGTAFATHLLLDARDLGHAVSEERLDESLEWMERQIGNFYEAGQTHWSADGAEPYFHYVLARADRARQARAEQLLGQTQRNSRLLERENRFLLMAALHLAGDHRYQAELKDPDISPISGVRSNGWTFYSDRRMRGLMLSTLVDLFGRDPAFEPLADRVAGALRGESARYSTQELVWGITGLGKFVEAGADSFKPPVLTADGRQIAPAHSERKSADRLWKVPRASEYGRLLVDVPEKGEGKLYAILSSEGVRTEPDWRTGGEGLRLTRRHLDASGQPLNLADLDLGDVVYIELSLQNTSGDRVSNIALVDRIPAGWEIENPRLGRDGDAEWINRDSLWQLDHMNLRDDRLEAFGHLQKGESRKVVYAVRAVTAGRFTVPPVEAEAMYDPRVWAREDLRSTVVAGPWGGGGAGME